jgi:RimJ/RimL family protein N-acetyltransferase
MKIQSGEYKIRDWKKQDASSIVKYANNLNVWINLRDTFPNPYFLSDAKAFLKQDLKLIWAISNDQEAIGCIGLEVGNDVNRYTAELGYWLGEPFWNRGIMTMSVKLITDFTFETLKIHRIQALPYTTNQASVRVLEKAGFTQEGRLHLSAVKNEMILDQYLYAKVDPQLKRFSNSNGHQ